MLRYTTFVIISFLLLGCSSKNLLENSQVLKSKKEYANHQSAKRYNNIRFEYKIAPHDRIQITVYAHPELSTTADHKDGILVNSRGVVSLPLIGAVKIGGLTQTMASRRIQNRYGEYLKKSSINLEVLNKRAYVIGEVKSPGVVALPNEQTALLQAIATVGGFSDSANLENIIIIRKGRRGSDTKIVDLTNPTSLSYATMMIKPNDIIYVAPTSMKDISTNISPLFSLINALLMPFVEIQSLTK